MKNIFHSKMNENAIVMMAVMKKCRSNASSDGHNAQEGAVKNSMSESNAIRAEK